MIKPKKGICTKCGKENYIVHKSGRLTDRVELCKYCNTKRTNKPTGEYELFLKIWNEREHVSFLTGKRLIDPFNNEIDPTSKFFVNCFAHVLSKKQHPALRLEKDNIVLLSPAEHYLWDFGTIKQREDYSEDWYKLYNLRESLIKTIIGL